MSDSDRHFLDITADVCPITFVKTKLKLEKLPPGAVLTVRLRGAEPLDNVPRSVRAHGHEVVSLQPEDPGRSGPESAHVLTIRRT
jgi:TusA-related sulfurtransferase